MKSKSLKALFYIEPEDSYYIVKTNSFHKFITEKLIHAGFKKAGIFNLPDGRVEVVLEGEKKDIERFHYEVSAHIVEWLEERAKDKEKLKQMIGNPGIVVSGIDYKPGLMILDIGLYSHSLEMSQLEKGVTFFRSERKKADTNCCSNSYMDVYYDLVAAIKESSSVSKELRGDLKEQAASFKEQVVSYKEQAALYKEQAATSKHLSNVLEKMEKKL